MAVMCRNCAGLMGKPHRQRECGQKRKDGITVESDREKDPDVKTVLPLCAALFLTACYTTVPVNPDGSRQFGETRSFSLPTGMGLNVTREGNQAKILYPMEYPLTDAEAADYIIRATGCRPTAMVSSHSTMYNRGLHRTYDLDCSGV